MPEPVEELVLAHSACVTPGILDAASNVPLQTDEEYHDDFEGMDQRDWIIAETEAGMLTEKQEMKSRAVEEC